MFLVASVFSRDFMLHHLRRKRDTTWVVLVSENCQCLSPSLSKITLTESFLSLWKIISMAGNSLLVCFFNSIKFILMFCLLFFKNSSEEEERSSTCSFIAINACSKWVWARVRPEARSSTFISHVGGMRQATWIIIFCLPGMWEETWNGQKGGTWS